MGFYKPTEGNPLRIYVGGERMSVQSCWGTRHRPRDLACKCQGQLDYWQEHSPWPPTADLTRTQQSAPSPLPPPCLRKQRSEGDMVRRTSKASPPPHTHHLPKVCSLSPLFNPNSEKRPELPMRLSLTAPSKEGVFEDDVIDTKLHIIPFHEQSSETEGASDKSRSQTVTIELRDVR